MIRYLELKTLPEIQKMQYRVKYGYNKDADADADERKNYQHPMASLSTIAKMRVRKTPVDADSKESGDAPRPREVSPSSVNNDTSNGSSNKLEKFLCQVLYTLANNIPMYECKSENKAFMFSRFFEDGRTSFYVNMDESTFRKIRAIQSFNRNTNRNINRDSR